MDALTIAEAVRAACLRAAEGAYEDAGMQGLCAEGRWEAAVGAVRALDLRGLAHDADRPPAAPGAP
jgi:hypothetical protein